MDYDRQGFPYPVLAVPGELLRPPGDRPAGGRALVERIAGRSRFRPALPAPVALLRSRCGLRPDRRRQPLPGGADRLVELVARVSDAEELSALSRCRRPTARLYDALQRSDYKTWRERPLSAVEDSGQQEILNWMCLMGAMDALGRRPTETAFVEILDLQFEQMLCGLGGVRPARKRAMPELPGHGAGAGADRQKPGGKRRHADRGGDRGCAAAARLDDGRGRPADRAAVDARADVLLHLWRLGPRAGDERLPALGQIPVLEADRRRIDARDAVSRRAAAARRHRHPEGGVPSALRPVLGQFGARPITSFRCAISRHTRIRSASPRSTSAPRSSNWPGWRGWRRRRPTRI